MITWVVTCAMWNVIYKANYAATNSLKNGVNEVIMWCTTGNCHWHIVSQSSDYCWVCSHVTWLLACSWWLSNTAPMYCRQRVSNSHVRDMLVLCIAMQFTDGASWYGYLSEQHRLMPVQVCIARWTTTTASQPRRCHCIVMATATATTHKMHDSYIAVSWPHCHHHYCVVIIVIVAISYCGTQVRWTRTVHEWQSVGWTPAEELERWWYSSKQTWGLRSQLYISKILELSWWYIHTVASWGKGGLIWFINLALKAWAQGLGLGFQAEPIAI